MMAYSNLLLLAFKKSAENIAQIEMAKKHSKWSEGMHFNRMKSDGDESAYEDEKDVFELHVRHWSSHML